MGCTFPFALKESFERGVQMIEDVSNGRFCDGRSRLFFARLSAFSFPAIPLCPGIQRRVTVFSGGRVEKVRHISATIGLDAL